jgi:hypothetical protein
MMIWKNRKKNQREILGINKITPSQIKNSGRPLHILEQVEDRNSELEDKLGIKEKMEELLIE